VKNVVGIMIEIVLNLCTVLDNMDILTTLILPIHELSFHFSVSYSISLINDLQLSEYRSLTSLVKFIPKYSTLFEAVEMGLFSQFLFDSSLLLLKLLTNFYILILYPATLLNSFISSNRLFGWTL